VCHARHRTTCPAPARKAFPGPRAIGASRSELLAKRQNWPICEDGSTSLARASVAPESAICSLASCCRSSALPSRAALPGQSRGPADNPGMHDRTGGAHQAGNTATSGLSVAVRETADGAHRPSQGPNPVRHASVDTATPRSTATQGDTSPDTEKRPASHENSQLTGRLRRWWQVMGSNHRRLSRRFYSPILLFKSYAADLLLCHPRRDLGRPPSAIRP
jgi:hypothetical protein